MTWMDRAAFLRGWLESPRAVGSLTPSSPRLARAVAEMVPWEQSRTVVELGAGTGAVTEHLRHRLPAGVRLLAFERQTAFQEVLRSRFPELEVHPEAGHLSRVLGQSGGGQADAIISGIPWALLTPSEQQALFDEIDASLAPGGCFVAYQYAPSLLSTLRRRFEGVRLKIVLANLPPAVVYRCVKPARV